MRKSYCQLQKELGNVIGQRSSVNLRFKPGDLCTRGRHQTPSMGWKLSSTTSCWKKNIFLSVLKLARPGSRPWFRGFWSRKQNIEWSDNTDSKQKQNSGHHGQLQMFRRSCYFITWVRETAIPAQIILVFDSLISKISLFCKFLQQIAVLAWIKI